MVDEPAEEYPKLISRVRRITMADVDAAGVLYFGAPYPWEEQLYLEFLAESGRPLSTLLADGNGAPCIASSAAYRRPLHLDVLVDCVLRADDIGRSSFSLRMDAFRVDDGELAVEVWTRQVWVTIDERGRFTPEPIPSWLRDRLVGAA